MAAKRSFKKYTLEQYVKYLETFVGKVKFPEVHVHGTWKPSIANFRKYPGEHYMQSMYQTHMSRGFGDIAQHATIDPDGFIWDGRSLLKYPASATGYNDSDDGDSRSHPFMFEMIGNFDVGQEKLEGAQLRTAVGLTSAVVDLFGSTIKFHREMTNLKTCPGSGISKAEFVAQVKRYKEETMSLKKEDANKIIGILKAVYGIAPHKEIGRLADELRIASGQPTENR
jgi:hypothetical protein